MNTFNESQQFNQWWLKIILFLPLFEVLAFMLNDYQNKGEIQTGSIVFLIVVLIAITLIFMCNLFVRIDEKGISYQFFPFHLKKKQIEWSEIDKAYIRIYKPLREYGGWGIRITFRNGKAYSIKGNIGLQLELKNGARILIGTGNQQKLDGYLQYLQQKQTIIAVQ